MDELPDRKSFILYPYLFYKISCIIRKSIKGDRTFCQTLFLIEKHKIKEYHVRIILFRFFIKSHICIFLDNIIRVKKMYIFSFRLFYSSTYCKINAFIFLIYNSYSFVILTISVNYILCIIITSVFPNYDFQSFVSLV